VGICTDDPNGNTIIIVIQGCIDIICVPVDVPVVIYNPCLDPAIYTIVPIIIPTTECTLYTDCEIMYPDWQIIASSQVVIDICGSLTYSYTTNVSINISIDINISNNIVIYCDDPSTIGTSIEINITVDLSIYTGCSGCGGGATGVIIIVTPCVTPSLTVGISLDINFNFNGAVTWTAPPVTVIPPTCTGMIIYSCDYVSGPYNGPYDLCNWVTSQTCPTGQVWSTDACMCLSELYCAQWCGAGLQLDPRVGCDCIPQT
jgi:hypothetical protein